MQSDLQSTQWFFRIADGLAVYFLGLRRKNFLVLSGTLLALFHLLPRLFAH